MGKIWSLVALAVCLGGCAVPARIPGATSAEVDNPNRALILGRIQVFRAGQQARVGPVGYAEESGLDGGERTLTEMRFHNLTTKKTFVYDVTDHEGGFEVLLPPGQYAIKLRYFKWLQATPARFEAEGGDRSYIGTLRVHLLRRWSVGGIFARTFGGTIPEKDSDFAVVDQWDWAEENLPLLSSGQVTAEKRLMRLGESVAQASAGQSRHPRHAALARQRFQALAALRCPAPAR
jgi:hypothetical protein